MEWLPGAITDPENDEAAELAHKEFGLTDDMHVDEGIEKYPVLAEMYSKEDTYHYSPDADLINEKVGARVADREWLFSSKSVCALLHNCRNAGIDIYKGF